MFITSIIFYILALSIHLFFINEEHLIVIIFIFLLLLISYCTLHKYKFNDYCKILCLYLLFFIFGFFVVSLHISLNKTNLLYKPLLFKNFYGEISKIETSTYDNKSKILLQNLIINNEDNPPSSARLTYNKVHSLEVGDIISATASFFPPSPPLIPYGFNFQKNSFFKEIGANGYIIGKVQVIENYNDSNYFEKINAFRDDLIKSFINMIKVDSSNNRTLPFLIALTIGQYTFLPQEDNNNLRTTSLAHYISISGYHISLIAAMIFFSLRKILALIPRITLFYDSKKIASILTIIILLFYLFILGDNLPAIRATIMTIGVLLAVLFNFAVISLNSLFLAAFILLFFIPQAILSAGFLLSFFATMAIIVFFNFRIIQKFYNYSKTNLIRKILFGIIISIIMTFFIEITILPILMYFFGNIPLLGIIANLLVAPLFSFLIMPCTILYFIFPNFIAIFFLRIAEYSLNLVLNIAAFLSSFSFSTYYVDFFPSYLLAIFLFAYIFFAINKNASRYYMLFPIATIFVYYTFFIKAPDILINHNMSVIAFKESDSPLSYTFTKGKAENFTKKFWFHNPKMNLDKQITESNNFTCYDEHCVGKINNTIVSFANNNYYVKEDCAEVAVIIITTYSYIKCNNATIIDKAYIAKYGATIINLK